MLPKEQKVPTLCQSTRLIVVVTVLHIPRKHIVMNSLSKILEWKARKESIQLALLKLVCNLVMDVATQRGV